MKSSSHGAYSGSEDEQSRTSTPATMPGSAYAALSATGTMYSHQATPYTSTQYAAWNQQQQHLHVPASASQVPLDAYGRPLHGSSASPGPMSSGRSPMSSQWHLATPPVSSSPSSSSQWPAAGQHPHAATFAPGAGLPQLRHQPQALYGSQLHVAGSSSSSGYEIAPDAGGSSDSGYIPTEYISHQQQLQHQQYQHQLYPQLAQQSHDPYQQQPSSHSMQVPSQASQQQYYQHSWPGNNSAAMPSRGLERPLTGHAAALSKQIEEARRTCEHCGKTYSRRDVMLRHAAKAHPATPDSSSPDTPVGNSSATGPHPGALASRKSLDTIVNQMSAAMDEHFRTCEHCGKVYSRRDGVLRHIANAHPEVAVVQAGRGRSGSASGSIHGHGV